MKKIFIILIFIIVDMLTNRNFLYSQNTDISKTLSEIFEEAQKYERQDNLEKALELYQTVFESSKETSWKKDALMAIGKLYQKQKRYKESLETYKKYLDLASTPFEISKGKTGIAHVYISQGEYYKGLKTLDEIIEEYPKTEIAAMAQLLKADIYADKIKDYESAIKEYEKIIEEYPDSWMVKTPFALEKIASCYVKLKKYDEAIAIYEKIINDYSNTPFEKVAKLNIEFINEYEKKGKPVPPEVIMKRMKEIGLGEGIISVEIKDGKIITNVK